MLLLLLLFPVLFTLLWFGGSLQFRLRGRRGKPQALGVWLVLAMLAGQSAARGQAPVSRLTGFLLSVEPQRHLMLRLLRFAPSGSGFVPADSAALTADGPLALRGAAEPGLYQLALDPYARTELILTPTETPHIATTVRQLAQRGVYIENSSENQAYYDVLPLIQHYDTLVAQVHEQLAQLITAAPATDTSRAYVATVRLLERYHRNLNRQLRDRQVRYPNTFAATVVAPLAFLPERPATAVGTAGYLSWLRAHYLDTFSLTTDAPLRHYLAGARLAYFLHTLGPLGPSGKLAAADDLLARREGHDQVNAWLYRVLVAEATRYDDDLLAAHLRLDYPPDACTPALPPALASQLAQMADLAIGQPLPDITTAADSTGHPVALRATVARQCLTAVVVWVSWCHTCEVELPQLAAAYPVLRRQGLEVVTLSLDQKRAPWVAALRRHSPPWPHSLAELVPLAQSQTARLLHVRLTPKLLLVNQAGLLVGRYASVADLTAAATAYLRSQPAAAE